MVPLAGGHASVHRTRICRPIWRTPACALWPISLGWAGHWCVHLGSHQSEPKATPSDRGHNLPVLQGKVAPYSRVKAHCRQPQTALGRGTRGGQARCRSCAARRGRALDRATMKEREGGSGCSGVTWRPCLRGAMRDQRTPATPRIGRPPKAHAVGRWAGCGMAVARRSVTCLPSPCLLHLGVRRSWTPISAALGQPAPLYASDAARRPKHERRVAAASTARPMFPRGPCPCTLMNSGEIRHRGDGTCGFGLRVPCSWRCF